jgi:hypothetical protein
MRLAGLMIGVAVVGSLLGCQSNDESASDSKVKAMLGSSNGRVDLRSAGGQKPKGAMEQKKAGANPGAAPGATPPGP